MGKSLAVLNSLETPILISSFQLNGLLILLLRKTSGFFYFILYFFKKPTKRLTSYLAFCRKCWSCTGKQEVQKCPSLVLQPKRHHQLVPPPSVVHFQKWTRFSLNIHSPSDPPAAAAGAQKPRGEAGTPRWRFSSRGPPGGQEQQSGSPSGRREGGQVEGRDGGLPAWLPR